MNVFDLQAVLRLDKSGFDSGLKEARSDAVSAGGRLSKSLVSVAKKVGKGLVVAGGAVAAFGAKSVKTGADFDKAMAQVAATMGLTTKEVANTVVNVDGFRGSLRQFAQKEGAETAFSATQAAEAMNYMALAGYDAKTTVQMLPKVLNLAAAGNMDLATASDMVTDAQSALGLSIDETNDLVDKMAKTSSKSNTSVSQLGDAILTIGGTARTAKGGTTELATMLGILADNGIKGSEGGTLLRNIMMRLQAPTKAAAATFKELGVDIFDSQGHMRAMPQIFQELSKAMAGMSDEERTQTIAQMFNKYDLKGVNALLNTTSERYRTLSGEIDKSQGAAQKMADTQLDNLSGDVTIMKSAFEGLQIALADKLSPTLRELVQAATKGINAVTKGIKNGTINFDGITAAVRSLVDTINKIGIENIIKGILKVIELLIRLTPEILATVAAIKTASGIVKIVSIVKDVIAIFKGLKGAFSVASGAISTITGLFTGAGTAAAGAGAAATTAGGAAAAAGGVALGPILAVVGAVVALIAIIIVCVKNWDKITAAAKKFAKFVSTGLSKAWKSIKDGAKQAAKNVSDAFKAMWNGLKSIFANIGSGIKTVIGFFENFVKGVANAFSNIIKNGINFVKSLFSTLSNGVKNIVSTVTGFFKNLFTNISNVFKNIINNALSFGKRLFFTLTSAVKNVVNSVVGFFKNLFSKIKNVFNNIISAAKSFGSNLVNKLKTSAKNAISKFISIFTTVVQKVRNIFSKVISAVVNFGKNVVSKIGGIGKNIVSGFINAFAGVGQKVIEIGKNLVTGIWDGISGATGWLYNKIKGFCSGIVSFIKGLFDIGSPSKVFANEIGKFLPQGIGVGFEKEMPKVHKMIEDSINSDYKISPNIKPDFSTSIVKGNIKRDSETGTMSRESFIEEYARLSRAITQMNDILRRGLGINIDYREFGRIVREVM